jgi:hypothetical protein
MIAALGRDAAALTQNVTAKQFAFSFTDNDCRPQRFGLT